MARNFASRRLLAVGVLGAVLFAVCASGCATITEGRNIAARAAYWRPQLNGDTSLGSSATRGSKLDIDDVFELGDEEAILLAADLRWRAVGLDVSYFELSEDGNTLLNETISYNGQTYSSGVTLDSSTDLSLATAHLRWGWLGFGPICIGPKFGADYLDTETRLSASGISTRKVKEDVFPVAGAFATFDMGVIGDRLRVVADLDFTGFTGHFDHTRGDFIDLNARVGVQAEFVALGVGYRHVDIELEQSRRNLDTDLELSGPMLYFELAF
ncbi:MAG: hypothetical protein ACKVX7_13625 [Planctomycetota bacterium]